MTKNDLQEVQAALSELGVSRTASVPLGGLVSRNPIVYKWKGPFRCWLLREAVFWRLHDLLEQSVLLHENSKTLGGRILLRSGFETLAILIYENECLQKVVNGQLDYHDFCEKTSKLLLGSRDGSTKHSSINILTILEKCDRRYPGIKHVYEALSESAHPNYEGLCTGYSKVDHDEFETNFNNRWFEMYGGNHLSLVKLSIEIFLHEYDDVWPERMEALEQWITQNDEMLEETKSEH